MPTKNFGKLVLDVLLLAALLLAMAPRITGLAIHEWLSIAFGLVAIFHVIIHWDWIVAVLPHFFAKLFHESRLNFFVDLLCLAAFVVVMASGVAISKFALPALGIHLPFALVWKLVHKVSADAALILAAAHCGLHWAWLKQSVKAIFRGKKSANHAETTLCDKVTGGK
jgi:hypothetical protein